MCFPFAETTQYSFLFEDIASSGSISVYVIFPSEVGQYSVSYAYLHLRVELHRLIIYMSVLSVFIVIALFEIALHLYGMAGLDIEHI